MTTSNVEYAEVDALVDDTPHVGVDRVETGGAGESGAKKRREEWVSGEKRDGREGKAKERPAMQRRIPEQQSRAEQSRAAESRVEQSRAEQSRAAESRAEPVSYTHLRAHETREDIVCRLLLEKKNLSSGSVRPLSHS